MHPKNLQERGPHHITAAHNFGGEAWLLTCIPRQGLFLQHAGAAKPTFAADQDYSQAFVPWQCSSDADG